MSDVLLAGFAAFPGAPENPTAAMARRLDGRVIRGGRLATVVLDVAWERSFPMLRTAIGAQRPRTVMLFGLHARAERLRIELVARNRRELGRADADGAFPAGPAVMDGPETLSVRLPLSRCAAALRGAGIDFEWSRNAGAYLCNDTLYRLAVAAGDFGVEQFGFFHVPLSDEAVEATARTGALPEVFCSLPAATLERAALALAEAVAGDGAGAVAVADGGNIMAAAGL